MWGDSGLLIVHSFAHGGAVYRLVHNEATLRPLIVATGSDCPIAASVLLLTQDSQIGANLRVCADEKDRADFDRRGRS